MMASMRSLVGLAAIALACTACISQHLDTVEQTSKGPTGYDMLAARSQMVNGREPNFDEKRIWESQSDLRIAKYLREHPELEQTPRYMDVRFWRQVSPGAARGEVEALLDEPQEQTVDPALMVVLAERHWDDIGRRAVEAWVYFEWAIFFDDKQVVGIVRKKSKLEPMNE
jgi:hypothetical protein